MSEGKGAFALELAGQAVPSNGGLGEILNPEGVPLIITRSVLYVETPSVGAANINVGIGNAGADNNSLLSAVAINGVITGKAYNGLAHPAAEAEYTVWGATQVLNATGSAACGAFVGRVFVEYIRAE